MAIHFTEEDKKKLQEDTSEIYQKRTKESTKKDVKNLDAKGKRQYFFDYYFKFVVVAVVVISILVVVLTETLKPHPEEVLYILVYQDMADVEPLEEFSADLEKYFQLDTKKEKIVVEPSAMDMKLQTYLITNMVDVVIMDEENFKHWGNSDSFFNAEEDKEVSFYKDYEEKYRFRAKHLTSEDFAKQEEERTAAPEDDFEYNSALYLTDSEQYKKLSVNLENPVIAIAKGTKHKEKAVEFVKYMMGK